MDPEWLDRYWADELGCLPSALYQGGVSIWAPPHRGEGRWMGWLIPLECIVVDTAPSGTGAISITPHLADALCGFFAQDGDPTSCLPPHGNMLLPFVREHLSTGYPKVHRILACDEKLFRPFAPTAPVLPLEPDNLHYEWYRYHFDGPVFIIRAPGGGIASWAAIKCKSDEVWEMAVSTEPAFRGRGYARSVVSRATLAALEAGKHPLYLHEISNHSSARVCNALGYRPYGYELTCETGRIPPIQRN